MGKWQARGITIFPENFKSLNILPKMLEIKIRCFDAYFTTN